MKKLRWEIVYEDDDCIVIDKPAQLLSVPDRYDASIPNLYSALQQYRPEVYINHRLDKETSGLILFSKNEKAYKLFSEMFEARQLDKRYHAIVHGVPPEEVGMINLSLSASKSASRGMVVNPNGKEAFTKFRILEEWSMYSHLEIKLLTGRMHQIRVHMQAISCPLICDKLYGDGRGFYLSDIKRKYRRKDERPEKALLERHALHASALSFEHPISSKTIDLSSDLPKDMKAVIYQLNKTVQV